jgi:hypothetical protein
LLFSKYPPENNFFGVWQALFSGIETNFKHNRGKPAKEKICVFNFDMGGENQTGCQKQTNSRQLECFEKALRHFHVQTNRAVFPGTIMLMAVCGQDYGKNNRKNYTSRQNKQRNFSDRAQFHGDYILCFSVFFGKP